MAELIDALIPQFQQLLGAGQVFTGRDAAERVASLWSRIGAPRVLVRPGSTGEVSAVLRLAHDAGAPVVAMGGRTGLVDGANAEGAIALSLERMRAVESIDPLGATMTVQAGCVLESACEAAEAHGLFLPLDLGSRGSATIGGVISTNAGGNRVLRYGMTRDMVLGLEAVLADGSVVSSLNTLIKNNTGYDLKQLFIGSEGTLGVVTRAVLRLRPKPASQQTALMAVDRFGDLAAVLRTLEQALGGQLSAFEVMWSAFYDLVTTPPALGRPILPPGHAHYVLAETLGSDSEGDAERFERVLTGLFERGLIADAVLAKSQGERDRMWALRDDVRQTGRNAPIVTFDISLPIAAMEAYLAEVRASLQAAWPDPTLTIVGHLGDGNLHLIVGVGDAAARGDVEKLVYAPLAAIGGSVSAEHGIGLQKRAYLASCRSSEEIALMRTVKQALDPKGVLNPGKILP